MRSRRRDVQGGRRSLFDVLQGRPRGMSPADLLTQAGHDAGSVDDFYAELKREVEAGRIREERPIGSEVVLRAVR